MNASELMIGDWVNLKNGKVIMPYRITVIGHATQDRNEIGTTVCVDLSKEFPTCIFDMDVITPIPLTPEILEKNGFEKNSANYHRIVINKKLDGDGFEMQEISVSEKNLLLIFTSTCDVRINIKHVHELQHALKLCGIEKTIEL